MSDKCSHFPIKGTGFTSYTKSTSAQASYPIGMGTTIRENQQAAQIAAIDTISFLKWCHICHECYCAGGNIDLGVIRLSGETVSLTPRMRDTNYRNVTPKYTDNESSL